ncbi:MAG: FAD-binding protein, partial [Rhizorhabdus sp.]
AYPMPASGTDSPYLVKGDSWDALFDRLDAKLSALGARSGGVRLAPGFAAAAKESLGRYDAYAKAGRDADFDRGAQLYDVQWHKLFSAAREGSPHGANPYPNITMHPFADEGPYYAFILAAGALDTNGGPRINHHAQVLSANGEPIPGLYGAGNCIAAPTRNAYYGAGGTIGPALTFGYIAANHALGKSV